MWGVTVRPLQEWHRSLLGTDRSQEGQLCSAQPSILVSLQRWVWCLPQLSAVPRDPLTGWLELCSVLWLGFAGRVWLGGCRMRLLSVILVHSALLFFPALQELLKAVI